MVCILARMKDRLCHTLEGLGDRGWGERWQLWDLGHGLDDLCLAAKASEACQDRRHGDQGCLVCSTMHAVMHDKQFDFQRSRHADGVACDSRYGLIRLCEHLGIGHTVLGAPEASGPLNPVHQVHARQGYLVDQALIPRRYPVHQVLLLKLFCTLKLEIAHCRKACSPNAFRICLVI